MTLASRDTPMASHGFHHVRHGLPMHAFARLRWAPGEPISVELPPTPAMAAALGSLSQLAPDEDPEEPASSRGAEEETGDDAGEGEETAELEDDPTQLLRLRVVASTFSGDRPVSLFIRAIDSGDTQLAGEEGIL
eukprot:4599113-Prymnesium_polylepis.1